MAQQQAARAGVNIFDNTKPMWQILLAFLVPLMASNMLQTASQTFGNIFVGRLLGVKALASSSVVFPIVFFLFAFLVGIVVNVKTRDVLKLIRWLAIMVFRWRLVTLCVNDFLYRGDITLHYQEINII